MNTSIFPFRSSSVAPLGGLLGALLLTACHSMKYSPSIETTPKLQWEQLADLPDRHGFAGSFAGFHGDTLLVAGGANFSEGPLWEGGKRIWHDRIFVWREGETWEAAGNLPGPVLGYGASVETPAGVICIGGSSSAGHFTDVFRLSWAEGKIHLSSLPSLPVPVASPAAARVGDAIYVAGGQARPDAEVALRNFWRLSLTDIDQGWQELEPWPGASRMLAVAGSDGESFYLFSGVEMRPGETVFERLDYRRDAYRYQPGLGWSRLADLPRGAVGAPSPAPFLDGNFVLSGGVDGSHLGIDPRTLPKLPASVLFYDVKEDRWRESGKSPAPHVVAPVAELDGLFYFVSGESHPGVRSPQVWRVGQERRK